MYIIVVGAGQIGTPLINIATSEGHEVVVIEHDSARANQIAQQFDCMVLHSDGTSMETLEEAGAQEADALISTTDRDAVNLMVCLLALEYKIRHVVSVVRDADHMNIFRHVGVHVMENPQRLIAEHLFRAVSHPPVGDYIRLESGAEVFEVEVSEQAPIAGLTLDQANDEGLLPADMQVVVIERPDAGITLPSGDTELQSGDYLIVYAPGGVDRSVMDTFGSG
ncbi:MAG: TrkA family potassium uptake protein [Actinobacteria bacterium]|nr:TrkA family potassium uptake protein [Actinomycetota bacterium]